jgi:hypothetical protein
MTTGSKQGTSVFTTDITKRPPPYYKQLMKTIQYEWIVLRNLTQLAKSAKPNVLEYVWSELKKNLGSNMDSHYNEFCTTLGIKYILQTKHHTENGKDVNKTKILLVLYFIINTSLT